MVRDIEDEIRFQKNPLPVDEDCIALLKSPYVGEIVEEIGSVSEKLNAQCDDGGSDVNSAPNIFYFDQVPPKKRRYLGTNDTLRSFEPLNEDACIVCDIRDDSVAYCSGNDCPLAVHRKCVELDCEDFATSYCPYCWFKDKATRSTTLRTMGVAAKKSLDQYGCKKLKSGNIANARENIQLENLHQLRKVVEQLKAQNFRLDETIVEKACGEACVDVDDQRKRVLWTPKEENMLRVGVETFAATINKNIPWKKILEMGKGIFHETRNSSDLKDKWRNMMRM